MEEDDLLWQLLEKTQLKPKEEEEKEVNTTRIII